MKKAISLLLTLAMVLTMLPTTAFGGFVKTRTWSDDLFTDVNGADWFYETVKTAYELELMNGSTGGRFEPRGNMTLAETVTDGDWMPLRAPIPWPNEVMS